MRQNKSKKSGHGGGTSKNTKMTKKPKPQSKKTKNPGKPEKPAKPEKKVKGARTMMRTITADSLKILMAIQALGPDVPTANVADFLQKVGVTLPTEGGSRKAMLQGSLRQSLRAHVKNGRLKFRKTEGHAHAGEIFLWSITPEGAEEISRQIHDFSNITHAAKTLNKN